MQARIPGSTGNLVIYEVNLHIAAPVAASFADWLPGHVEDMLALPGFIDAVIAGEEADDNGSVAWSVRYRLRDRQALDDYFTEHAGRMRADGVERFGEHMQASRRILIEFRQLRAD